MRAGGGGGNHRPRTTRYCCSPTPKAVDTQWATSGAHEAHCRKEWLARKGKEPPTKPGGQSQGLRDHGAAQLARDTTLARMPTTSTIMERTAPKKSQTMPHQPTHPRRCLGMPITRQRLRTNGTCRTIICPSTPPTGQCKRADDTSRSKGHSGRENATTRCSMKAGRGVIVQGPVKKHQPDQMSHMGSLLS